ncbi:MAG: neutral/alkaline non-lysosomal ceramidase N-terminal domain-containing protein [Candidatus Tectomicrobia bacterium]|uniref:Neutral/alkaline non-lysosomal ceramidase N-terminal domain-containing protein n=1 Tax=Tectimicrobiota bacterium TaxID=2528274 RepID=A0A932CL90_UNCTE|nr:neutral/alkaline non-lysosomal ceramidase N-terminal domain-containing protein [Candidatus Tectomicrobia bacterium]
MLTKVSLFCLMALVWVASWGEAAGEAPPSSPAAETRRASHEPLWAGAAKEEITPTERVYLAGFGPNRASRGVHDPLHARALVLKQGEVTIGLVVLDLLGLWGDDVRRIKRGAKEILGDRLIVASTHDHSAPDLIGAWGPSLLGLGLLPYRSGVDRDYLRLLRRKVVSSLRAAHRNLREARLKFASTQVDGVSVNIRDRSRLDKELVALRVEAAPGGETIATLINFACHAEVLWSNNRLVTADFPGYLCRKVEEELGGTALFFNAALGGMVTANVARDSRGKELHTFAEAERIGHTLARAAVEALRSGQPAVDPELSWKSAELAIPFENWRYRWARRFGILKRKLDDGRLRTEVAVVGIGPGQMVTVPGEPLPNLGWELKKMMGGPYKFVLGLAGDELGYILDEQDFSKRRYAYERSMSVSRQTWPIVYRALKGLLQEQEAGHPIAR